MKRDRFKRTTGLFGAAAKLAGPSVIYSYLICGLLALATTLMYAEQSRIIPRSGGGYRFAYDVLGSIGGFASGWFLALGSLFASGLYAIGFAEYALSLTGAHYPAYVPWAAAIGITMLIALTSAMFSGKSRFDLQGWIVWGNVGILLLLIVVSFFGLTPERARPVFPRGVNGTGAAIFLIYVSFFGYQLIANNAEEIINPEKTIPKAMILSMVISLAIHVLVADRSFAGKGWVRISLGGILASLGALSSTLVSQSRQTYVMGIEKIGIYLPHFRHLNLMLICAAAIAARRRARRHIRFSAARLFQNAEGQTGPAHRVEPAQPENNRTLRGADGGQRRPRGENRPDVVGVRCAGHGPEPDKGPGSLVVFPRVLQSRGFGVAGQDHQPLPEDGQKNLTAWRLDADPNSP